MSDLDEIEKMARAWVDATPSLAVMPGVPLARFILLALPVVNAAEALADTNEHAPRGDYAKAYALRVLNEAIATMRAGLEKNRER